MSVNQLQENGYSNPSFAKEGADEENQVSNNGRVGDADLSTTEDRTEQRQTWGKGVEFLMSCIAMNVGLGNIWRFPFVAYENGGGAFLIPYIIVLLFLGRPMYYLEMCLGQFCSRGNVMVFGSLAPILKGIGYGQLIGMISIGSYYGYLMALCFFYLINSFTSSLPWATCNPEWVNHSLLEGNLECVPSNYEGENLLGNNSVSSAELYYRLQVLKEATDISEGIGIPDWILALCLLGSWLVTFSICAKGVQTSGKASYFLALFPYVILFALLFRAVTLDGSATGILYYLNPKWEKLLDPVVWYAAVTQCFFSLNIGFGTVTMYASYNNFNHNVYRDAMIVTTLDTFTSFMAGTIIFGILGNLAFKMGLEIPDVVKSGGTGLAFISYPEAIARFDVVPWLFALLFFLMLFVLAAGCLVALIGSLATVIMDSFPHLKMWHVSLGSVLVWCLIGIVYTTPGGQWIFTMVDYFGGTFIFFVLNIFEITVVAWWYGLDEICADIEYMTKRKTGPYWRLCWGLLIPLILILVFFFFVTTLEPLTYEKKQYPDYVIVWGWILLGAGLSQTVLWIFIETIRRHKKKLDCRKIMESLLSHDGWGPQDPTEHMKWKEFKEKLRAERMSKNRNWIQHTLCALIGKK